MDSMEVSDFKISSRKSSPQEAIISRGFGVFLQLFVLAFLDVPSFMRLQQATKSSCSVRDVLSKLEKTVVHSA